MYHLIPRKLNYQSIKNFFFPDISDLENELKPIFHSHASSSLFLILFMTGSFSIMIFILSLFSNLETLSLLKSQFVLIGFFFIVLTIHKIYSSITVDYTLLVATVFFIATWGISKDIVNFGIFFNSYGLLYVTIIFFGLIFMPFKPVMSLILGGYCSLFYLLLWSLFIRQIFGIDWIINLGNMLDITFVNEHIQFISDQYNSVSHKEFFTAWHLLRYLLFGFVAFVFRAANMRSYIKTFIIDRKLYSKENQLATLQKMLLKSENQHLEFKSSARWDYRAGKTNKELEKIIVKTVAGFMNSDGGILFIGVDDDGIPLGLQNDYNSLKKKDSDGFEIFLIGLISQYIGKEHYQNIDISFVAIDDKEICSVNVQPYTKPVFIEKMDQAFYVRTGNNTQKMKTKEALEYIESHFE